MDKIIECLKEYGADIDGAMGRFIGDTDLYKSCFSTFIADDAFLKLGEALNAMDYDMAFEYAHSLKGTTGNMGLTPLYLIICNIVSDLRESQYSYLKDYYSKVLEQLNILKGIAIESQL